MFVRLVLAFFLVTVVGCARAPGSAAQAPPKHRFVATAPPYPPMGQEELEEPIAEQRAKRSVDGLSYLQNEESLEAQLAKEQPLVFVFFATWCELCAKKVATVRRASREVEGAHVVYVAVDDERTKSHVPGFMREQRLSDAPVIDGLAHPELIDRLNPLASIPYVIVLSGSGALVDTQIGLRSGDGLRLEESLRAAVNE